jgi:hypothetical protein
MTRVRLHHGDGLIDLAFGLVVLSLGLADLFGWEITFLPIFIILFIPLERALKQRITVPRLHTVSFVPPPNFAQKQRRVLLVTGVGVAIVLLLFLVILVIGRDRLPAEVVTGLQRAAPLLWMTISAGVLGLLGLLAWIVGAKRVVGYIGLLAITVFSGFWLPTIVPMLFVVLGASIMLIGAVLLACFIHDHPLQVGSASSGR